MSECPSCGRFTGPYETCPYCGAHLRGRAPLRWLKIAALVLALAGLGGLWFLATRTEIPRVRNDQVSGMMNMAYVRIEGRVSRGPNYNPDSQTLTFYVTDESGEELMVSAFRSQAARLIEQHHIPALEDRVSVAGNLRVREDFTGLSLNAPEQLQIMRPEPEEARLGDLTLLDIGRRVRVRGLVRQVYSPYAGLTLITLLDDSGRPVAVAVSKALELLTGPLPPLAPGQGLEVVAAVTSYRDTVQLVPASTADLVPAADLTGLDLGRSIGSLTLADAGRWVLLQGQIVETDPFRSGMRFTLDDGSGRITLLLWDSVYAQVPYSRTLEVGARVQVVGAISEYRGKLEIVPDLPQDVSILVAAPEPEKVALGALGQQDEGRRVQVTGLVVEGHFSQSNVRLTLDDGSGQIVLLLWESLYAQVPQSRTLDVGARVQVLGNIAVYKGELEIVPGAPTDIVILEAAPPPVEVSVGALTSLDVGRLVVLRGRLTASAPLSGGTGMRYTLDDGSGQIVLLVWSDVGKEAPAGLAEGSEVRVTGVIEEYRGTLEIVPRRGSDIVVLGPP